MYVAKAVAVAILAALVFGGLLMIVAVFLSDRRQHGNDSFIDARITPIVATNAETPNQCIVYALKDEMNPEVTLPVAVPFLVNHPVENACYMVDSSNNDLLRSPADDLEAKKSAMNCVRSNPAISERQKKALDAASVDVEPEKTRQIHTEMVDRVLKTAYYDSNIDACVLQFNAAHNFTRQDIIDYTTTLQENSYAMSDEYLKLVRYHAILARQLERVVRSNYVVNEDNVQTSATWNSNIQRHHGLKSNYYEVDNTSQHVQFRSRLLHTLQAPTLGFEVLAIQRITGLNPNQPYILEEVQGKDRIVVINVDNASASAVQNIMNDLRNNKGIADVLYARFVYLNRVTNRFEKNDAHAFEILDIRSLGSFASLRIRDPTRVWNKFSTFDPEAYVSRDRYLTQGVLPLSENAKRSNLDPVSLADRRQVYMPESRPVDYIDPGTSSLFIHSMEIVRINTISDFTRNDLSLDVGNPVETSNFVSRSTANAMNANRTIA